MPDTLQTLELNFLVTVQAPLDREVDREWVQNTVRTYIQSLLKSHVQMPTEVTLQHSREM